MTTARLVLAIVSTTAVEAAYFAIWRWVLPEYDINIPLWVLISVMVAWTIFAVLDFWFVTHVLKKQAIVGLPTMLHSKGRVASPIAPEGFVRIKSELWRATSAEGDLKTGEEVTVVGEDGLQLVVRRADSDKAKH